MSMKGLARAALPRSFEAQLKRAIYQRNCRLAPTQYRDALQQWYLLLKLHRCELDAPVTMTDKINWLKLYDATRLKGRLADKLLVREWVAEHIGKEYLVPLLGVWDSPDEIDFAALPKRFVLKATHGSGWNVVVVDKDRLDVERVMRRLRRWLACRQAMRGGFEMHYEYCEPRIICEQYLEDSTGGLRDYKFMTFDGAVQFVFAVDRVGRVSRSTYLPSWRRAPFEYTCESSIGPDVPAPSGLRDMIRAAEILGRGFACVRIDFYEVDGRVYFGEMTFTDANGLSDFVPARYNYYFGERLTLPEPKTFKGVLL
ncbi:MAG: glycosyl transferase [Actinomyces ruminicola]|uniref:TupA-like ATPgrasp n=1 Tax=Actinomyces ruminicola TaxID=332524 RepID=A0A1G9TVQ3_9ACTO|nr:ATP-grasp fold amidoligase family protein [Actinomyces ruminicola]MBE6481216.1 glycosyl transferase [Actinomyces ruminicola]SDM51671.1 TupA-like ATPgrasp [Actinomyces ruminicola]